MINKYKYKITSANIDDNLLFTIKDNDLNNIFEQYAEFKDVFKVRALKRYHYLTKLRK